MKQRRAMHEGCMLVSFTVEVLVRILGVEAFIMAHDPISDTPETCNQSQNKDDKIDGLFQVYLRRSQQWLAEYIFKPSFLMANLAHLYPRTSSD
jgi:hypothetical protein